MLYLFISFIYYAMGVGSFIYWWTHDHDFTLDHIVMSMLAGLFGPLAFIMGAIIHSDSFYNKHHIIIVKRKTKC